MTPHTAQHDSYAQTPKPSKTQKTRRSKQDRLSSCSSLESKKQQFTNMSSASYVQLVKSEIEAQPPSGFEDQTTSLRLFDSRLQTDE